MRSVVYLSSVVAASAALANPIVIDGEFDDWDGAAMIGSDAKGDAVGPFDIQNIWYAFDAERLYFSFDVGTDLFNIQNGEYAPDEGISVNLVIGEGEFSVDFFRHEIFRTLPGDMPVQLSGTMAQILAAPTYAAPRYEMSVPRSHFPDFVFGVIAISGSDNASGVFQFTSPRATPSPAGTAERPAGTDLRIASMNTQSPGILDAEQRAPLLRLVRAAKADVYCIQEEYNSSASQIAEFFDEADPFDDQAEWNVLKSGDHAVVSRAALTEPPLAIAASIGGAAAFVAPPARGAAPLLVVSVHPQWGGYVGHWRDNERIDHANSLADAFESVADGDAESLVPGSSAAPIFVVGDWNLVGSRTPLTILEERSGLAAPPLLDLGTGANATTWRSLPTSLTMFFPGLLDLMAHDPARVERVNAFVLNTETLDAPQLGALALQATDSFEASDHLMLVADYAFFATSADLNADGVVDTFDLAIVLAGWGRPGPADLTGDGIVDTFDLAVLLAAWD